MRGGQADGTARSTADVTVGVTLTWLRALRSTAQRMPTTGRGHLGAFVPSLKARLASVLSRMLPPVGFKPTTSNLLSGCSAN